MIKQIGLPLRGRPILLITRMITDRIGLHSVLLPLHISQVLSSLYHLEFEPNYCPAAGRNPEKSL